MIVGRSCPWPTRPVKLQQSTRLRDGTDKCVQHIRKRYYDNIINGMKYRSEHSKTLAGYEFTCHRRNTIRTCRAHHKKGVSEYQWRSWGTEQRRAHERGFMRLNPPLTVLMILYYYYYLTIRYK